MSAPVASARWFLIAALLPLACGSASNGASTGDAADPGGAADGAADAGAISPASGKDAGTSGGPKGGSPDDSGSAAPPEASADGAASGEGPYGNDGPQTYSSTTIQVPAPNGTFTATVYVPAGSAPSPVVILSSGLQQPGAAYAPYAKRLASWGVLTFLRDDPGVLGASSASIAGDVGYMVSTWLAATSATSSSPLAGRIDTTRIGLAGHSRGGQVSLLAAEGGAHGLVKGIFGLDPVDSAGDGGVGLAASSIAGVGAPLALLGETTDSAASSCAPAADNYEMFYAAASSPAVAVTAIGADHTMFEDPASCAFCTFCTAGTANAAQVLATAQRYLMAFFARQLLGDSSVGAAFAGAGAAQDVAAGRVTIQWK